MCRIDSHTMLVFQAELSKVAAVPWQALGGNVGALMGGGAALGAGIGGLREASRRFHEAKEEGESTSSAMLRAGVGGLGGALEGGLVGGGLGAAAGAGGTALAPELIANVAKRLGSVGRFGQRQVHAITGWTPEEGLGSIGGGAQPQRDAARAAQEHLDRMGREGADHGELEGAQAALEKAHARRRTAEDVEGRGMTSIPGAIGALRKDPVGTLKAGLKDQWVNSPGWGKAMMIGMPAMDAAHAIAGKENPEHGRGEMLGCSIGGLASGAALAGAPLSAQILGGMFAGPAIGGFVGRTVDKLRNRGVVNRQPELEPVDNQQHIPTERSMSPAAAGMAPEGMGG